MLVEGHRSIKPAYSIPLDDGTLLQLGLFFAIWSQVDLFMSSLLRSVSGVDPDGLTSGARLRKVAKALGEIHDAEPRRLMSDFLIRMDEMVDKRNGLAHGVWGFEVQREPPTTNRALYRSRDRAPIYPDELPDLISGAAEASRLIHRALLMIWGIEEPPEPGQAAFFFGEGPPPDWL